MQLPDSAHTSYPWPATPDRAPRSYVAKSIYDE